MTEITWSMNLLMGAVYLVLGALLLDDLLRGWSTLGFSHFGAGIIAVLNFLWIVRALYRDARADWHRHATTSA